MSGTASQIITIDKKPIRKSVRCFMSCGTFGYWSPWDYAPHNSQYELNKMVEDRLQWVDCVKIEINK